MNSRQETIDATATVETEETVSESDRADVRARLPIVPAETLMETHIRPAVITESAKEKTDTLAETDVVVLESGSGTETEGLLDETVAMSHAESAEAVATTCSTTAEAEEVVATAISVPVMPLLLPPKDAAPALRRSPRSLHQT